MSQYNEIEITPNEAAVLAVLRNTRLEEDHNQALQQEICAAGEASPDLPVVVDMSNVQSLPSLSIGTLVGLLQKFKQDRQRFMLAGLQPYVREVLTTCRLDKLFEICDSVDDALLRIRQSG